MFTKWKSRGNNEAVASELGLCSSYNNHTVWGYRPDDQGTMVWFLAWKVVLFYKPLSLALKLTQALVNWVEWLRCEFDSPPLVQRLRIGGALHPFTHIPLWHLWEQLYPNYTDILCIQLSPPSILIVYCSLCRDMRWHSG